MKKLIAFLLILQILFAVSCVKQSSDLQPEAKLKELSIPFESNINAAKFSIIVKVKIENGQPKFISNELEERQFTNSETGKQGYGFFLKQEDDRLNGNLTTRSPNFRVTRGYAFTGSCFEYGTLYEGDNGSSIFVACGFNCFGFDPICGWT